MQKHGVTETQVQMGCNGCVQKVNKSLHGIDDKQIDNKKVPELLVYGLHILNSLFHRYI